MKRISLLFAGIAACISLVSCGGGGSGPSVPPDPTKPIKTDVLNVAPNQAVNQVYGNETITASTATFPTGTTLTNDLFNSTGFLYPPANTKLKIFNVTELKSVAANQQPINISIAGGNSNEIKIVAYRDANDPTIWHWSTTNTGTGATPFQLSTASGRSLQDRSVGQTIANTWNWLVASFIDNVPDTDSPTPLLLNNSSNTAGKRIFVGHGILDNVGSITDLANYLHLNFGAYLTYGMPYNYLDGGATAVSYFQQQLNSISALDKSIMLFLHSRGGLIGRDLVEHKIDPTKISDVIAYGTPNTGATIADPLTNLKRDMDQLLNDPFSICPTPQYEQEGCVTEMATGSSYLNALNLPDLNNGYNQRVAVNYYFFAGSKDSVVPQDSALAKNVVMEEITSGAIERHIVQGAGHCSIKTDKNVMAEVVNFVKNHSDAAIDVSLASNNVDAASDGWNYTIILKNNTGSYLPVHDLTMADYDQYGNSLDTSWLNPGLPDGQFFPYHFYMLDSLLVLAPYGTWSKDVHLWLNSNKDPIWNFTPQYQCGTTKVIVRAAVNSERQAVKSVTLTRHYGSIVPINNPITMIQPAAKARSLSPTHTPKSSVK